MKKILIIDDDRPLAELLGMFLQTFGYPEPVYAGDGNEGLFCLKQEPNIVLVFTDREMPHLDGLEFIEQCRKKNLQIKIILMSGALTSDDDLIAFAKEIRADAALPKPFLPHKVLDALTLAGISPAIFR